MGIVTDYTANIWVDTSANLNSANPVPKLGEIIWAYDTKRIVIGDGVTAWNSFGDIYIDFANGRIGVRDPGVSGDFEDVRMLNVAPILTGKASNGSSGLRIDVVDSTSGFLFRLQEDGATIIGVDYGCINNLLMLSADEYVKVGGAFITAASLTVTTGTYNAIDVTGVANVYCDTSGGDITINGFTNGVTGQPLDIIKTALANDLILNHNNGSGTEKLIMPTNGNETESNYCNRRIKRGGSTWFVGR